jgi:DNA-binding response OmpR family regulator
MNIKTILLVEDDENDAFFVQRAFDKTGVVNPVQVVRDGQEAINYLQGVGKFAQRDNFPLPGIILLDLKLPYVMGLDVLKWIRKQSGLSSVVVILTSSAEEKDIATAYRLGANAYLVKPAEMTRLEGMVKSINDFWLLHNTPPPISSMDREPNVQASLPTRGFKEYERPGLRVSPLPSPIVRRTNL